MMSKIGFTTWLLRQSERDDPIGDLARDANADMDRPHGSADIETRRTHLWLRHADDVAMDALENAWTEYQQITSHSQSPE